ncbi:hypothetical protein IAR55_000134 [Kwoniella newhampshirensis]|uniref:Uncharacterized protein n=1 Tax=Kwoniella newhampshirensis TaxID=1651941 RepID=A0AAW0Z5T8_9TREE
MSDLVTSRPTLHHTSRPTHGQYDTNTCSHLEYVLTTITRFPPALIRVVNHLLDEYRLAKVAPLSQPQSFAHIPTLSTLTAQPSMSKRKRSITHYDGIPLTILSSSSSSSSSSSLSCCSTPPQSSLTGSPSYEIDDPHDRIIIVRRKIRDLERAMKGLGLDEDGTSSSRDSTRSSASFTFVSSTSDQAGGYGYDHEYKTKDMRGMSITSMAACDDQGQNHEDDDDESDDEDDVIFLLHC